jgi:hypothetical protein
VAVTIVFNAMCLFRQDKNGDPVTVYLPTEGGAHQACITAPTKGMIDVNKTSWKPKYLGYVQMLDALGQPAFQQIAVWPLEAERVKIGGTGGVDWPKRKNCLDLSDYHTQATIKLESQIVMDDPKITIVNIGDGSLAPDTMVQGTIEQPKGTKNEDRFYAKRIVWTGAVLSIYNSAGQVIQLTDQAVVAISNLAAVPHPEGLSHFKEYYGLIDPKGEKEIAIIDKEEEVYDCVPPAPAP